ncbi:proline-rich domain-containing protein [Frondihabitans cladoniiphilus]|uniref:Uncharacterized protein n=1 Tax=Frondihabitans cladoniiphilus TaxID=715785 RepID=A0ABP8VNC3_9MICO
MTTTGRLTPFSSEWIRRGVRHSVIWSLVAAALVAVVCVITGSFGAVGAKALTTIALLLGFALISWYDAEVSAKRSTWFAIASAGTSVFLLLVGLVKLWLPSFDGSSFGAWLSLVAIIRVGLLHVHLLLGIYGRFATRLMSQLSHVTVALVAVLMVLLALPPLANWAPFSEGYWRFVAAVGILDALGTILVPLIHVLLYRDESAPFGGHGAFGEPEAFDEASAYGEPGAFGEPLAFSDPTISDPTFSSPTGAPQPFSPPTSGYEPIPAWGSRPVPRPQVNDGGMHGAPVSEQPRPAAPALAGSTFAAPTGPESYVPPEQDPAPLRLAWPRYADGKPLPRKADGSPDFAGVVGYRG